MVQPLVPYTTQQPPGIPGMDYVWLQREFQNIQAALKSHNSILSGIINSGGAKCALIGGGKLTAIAAIPIKALSAFVGGGSLSAIAYIPRKANLVGGATLMAAQMAGFHSASLVSTAAISAAPSLSYEATVALMGGGILGANNSGSISASVALSAASSMVADALAAFSAAFSAASGSGLSATASLTYSATAGLSSGSGVSATASMAYSATGALSSSSSLSATASLSFAASAALAGGSALSATPTPATSYLLDGLTSTARGYGFRQLSSSATKCFQCKRDSDGNTQDIGFVSGFMDVSSLATFCSGTTGRIHIWYDQGPGGFDLGSEFADPIIYTSGAVVTQGPNSIPCPSFNSALLSNTGSVVPTSADFSTFSILYTVAVNDSSAVYGGRNTFHWGIAQQSSGSAYSDFNSNSSPSHVGATGTLTANHMDTVGHERTSGNVISMYLNGTAGTGGTSTASNDDSTLQVGGVGGGQFASEAVAELIILTAINSTDRAAIQTSQKAYAGTP